MSNGQSERCYILKEVGEKMKCSVQPNVDDRACRILAEMAKEFFTDPENQARYRTWFFEKYGRFPDDN